MGIFISLQPITAMQNDIYQPLKRVLGTSFRCPKGEDKEH